MRGQRRDTDSQGNNYLFPYCQGSMDHVIGYHAINKMSTRAGVAEPKLLTATKIRHYTSTQYAQLELPETDRELLCLCVISNNSCFLRTHKMDLMRFASKQLIFYLSINISILIIWRMIFSSDCMHQPVCILCVYSNPTEPKLFRQMARLLLKISRCLDSLVLVHIWYKIG